MKVPAATVLAWFATASIALAAAPLVDAVRTGDAEAVQALLAKGADVKARDNDGGTALLWAVHNEDAALVRRLLAGGADPKALNNYGAAPMIEAAVTGNAEILGLLIAAGAEVETRGSDGQTPLMVVARSGGIEAARLLIGKGADVNAVEKWDGQTALMWAAAQSHVEMIRLLIEHGAKVDAQSNGYDWERRVTAEPRPKDMYRGGLTPLLFAAREGCIACAKALIDGGAQLDLANPDGTTPLLMALLNVHFEMAQQLIKAGAEIDTWDFSGRSPIYVAIDMDVLPETGRADLPSDEKMTAFDVAQLLLDKGANPNLQLKLRPPYRNVVQDKGGDNLLTTGVTPLLLAAKMGDARAISLLLKYKAKVDLPTAAGVTPLMAAAFVGQWPATRITRGKYKTEEQAAACVKLLLEAGGAPNAKSNLGQTALHVASQLGHNSVIKLLVAGGADLTVQDAEHHTALDYAKSVPPPGAPIGEGRKDTVALLEQLAGTKSTKLADASEKGR